VSALQHHRAPDGLAPGPGYSHAVTGRGRWVATSGQVAFDEAGRLVGPGDPEAQVRGVGHLPGLMIPADSGCFL
jgi:enamine deaminase RidA (YjgF/YER057c/UK114 family)